MGRRKLLCGKWKDNSEWFFIKEIGHSLCDGMLYLFLRGRRQAWGRECFMAVLMRPSSRKRAAAEK